MSVFCMDNYVMTMSVFYGLICLVSDNIPSITDFGWEIKDGQVVVKWMTMPVAPNGILGNVKCGCKSGCSTRRCACVKAELKCTGLCGCNGCVNFDSKDSSMTDEENVEFDDDVEADDVFG